MSIANEIQRIQSAKADIKSAIEEKGVTVGDGTIDTYANLINLIPSSVDIPNNPEMQTGSFRVPEDTAEAQHISWNMSKTPNYFVVYADNDEQTTYTFLCLFYGDFFNSFTNTDKQFLIHHGATANTYGGGQRSFHLGGVQSIDKNGVSFIGFGTQYYFRSSINYKWIAWTDEANTESLYEQGFEDGKNSVYSADRFFRNCKQVKICSLNDLYEIYGSSSVVINLDKANTLEWFCAVSISEVSNVNTTVEHLTINCPNQVSNIRELLYCGYNVADNTLKRLTLNVDTSKSTNFWGMFAYQQALEVVDGYPIDCSSATGSISMFNSTTALKDMRFVANTIKASFNVLPCPNLSTETTQSIIDGLADLTGGTAQTLTLHATVGGKLTDTQKATITAKNWTLVY